MNNKKLIIAGAIGAALATAAAGGAAWAHHAFAAEFDGKAPVLLRGKVTRVEWINPHRHYLLWLAAALMTLLEHTFGRARFDAYLRGYFRRHAFSSIVTDTFVNDLRTHLLAQEPGVEARLRLDEWIHQPGLPDNAIEPQSAMLAALHAIREANGKVPVNLVLVAP